MYNILDYLAKIIISIKLKSGISVTSNRIPNSWHIMSCRLYITDMVMAGFFSFMSVSFISMGFLSYAVECLVGQIMCCRVDSPLL